MQAQVFGCAERMKNRKKKKNLKVKIPELNEGSESRCHGDTVPAERWWFGFMQMWVKPFLICPDANFPSASAAAMIPLSPGKAAGWLRSDWGREKKSVQIVGLSFHRVQWEISHGWISATVHQRCLEAEGLLYCIQFSSSLKPVPFFFKSLMFSVVGITA